MMNSPKKIFCIMGYSATGKDTLVKKTSEQLGDKVKILVSHTTRPMRKNEKDGVDYYFIDNKEFIKMKEHYSFIESRIYKTKVEKDGDIVDDTWMYGLSVDEINSCEYGMFIVDADGFRELRKHYGNDVVIPIYIKANEELLRQRLLTRGDLLDEANRRLEDDKKKFFDFRVKTVYKEIKNEGNIDEAVKELVNYIKKEIEE